MESEEQILEYEFIDISIDCGYEQGKETIEWNACEEVSGKKPESGIIYDADGIPMGNSIQEIRIRETIIADFLSKWRKDNPDGKIYNGILQEYIYVRAISLVEAKEHSSKSYNSTRALMILDEVLKNASPVKRVPKKSEDKNQKEFSYFLVMIYKHNEIGSIKLTVGVKKNHNKIQYGISALKPGEPVVDYSKAKKLKRKRSPQK